MMITILTRTLIFVLLALGVTACANLEGFQRRMDAQLGRHIDDLRQHYGYNYIERVLPDGLTAYTWTWVEHGVIPGYRSPTVIHSYKTDKGRQVIVSPGHYFPPEFYETNCEFSFIVDASGHAISWRAHGNGCAGYPGPAAVRGPAQTKPPTR